MNEEIITTVTHSTDLSVFGMFIQASFIVKCVMILLICASIVSWAIILLKYVHLKQLKIKSAKFEEIFWNCGSIDHLYENIVSNDDNPIIIVFSSGMKELYKYKAYITANNVIAIQEKIFISMKNMATREISQIEKHTDFLATVGSTAPFIGLFGTVWGIMNSFEAIGVTQDTNLSSVAPGISEALFATALGLIVTIPAVIAYNRICVEIDKYQENLDHFIYDFINVIYLKVCSSFGHIEKRYGNDF